jgi:hypothetical protein
METATLEMQRTVLTRLLELTAQQARALDAGDMSSLNTLSEARAKVVRLSAAYLPPTCAWDPALEPQVTQLQRASEQLQSDLRGAMDQVRRDLQELAKREQLTQYLKKGYAKSPSHLVWKG